MGASVWQALDIGGPRVEVKVSDIPRFDGCRLWPSIGEYPVYDDFLYGLMLQDQTRNTLFSDAIAKHARGRTVVELGPGPSLLWSRLAAEAGAERVLAVEVLEESADAARRLAAELGPHVSVFHGDSTAVTLPTKGDMCIAELVGAIGGAEGIAEVIGDAWRRHLQPGAVVVPSRVRTRIAGIAASRMLGDDLALEPDAVPYLEQLLQHTGTLFDFRLCISGITPSHLMTTSDLLEDLSLDRNVYRHARHVELEVASAGVIDSCILWVELTCADDQPPVDTLSSATNWVPVLLPFALEAPIPVQQGDLLSLDVTRSLSDEVHPEWTFAGAITRRDGASTPILAELPYASGGFRRSWLHRELLRQPVAPKAVQLA